MKKIIITLLVTVLAQWCCAQGAYLEFKITGEGSGLTGNMKLYMQDGSSRSEIQINIPQMPGGGINMSTLMMKDDEKTMYLLDDKAKTYSVQDLSAYTGKNAKETEYEVTVLGKEKVNGYNATHVRVKAKDSESVQEMWTSTEIKDYEKYKSIKSKYTNASLFKALTAKGADGFPVRMKLAEHSQTMQMDLVKAEAKNNPASLFSLEGYAKSTTNTAAGMPNMQEMMQKMQNMTPEEREAMLKQLKEQYGKH